MIGKAMNTTELSGSPGRHTALKQGDVFLKQHPLIDASAGSGSLNQ